MAASQYEHEFEVRFRDCDAFGHVNNAVYLSYLEQTRVEAWHRMMGTSGMPRSMILARVEIDYRVPATLGDRLRVRQQVVAIGTKSFTLLCAIENVRTRALVAEARTVMVMYDYAAGASVPIPADVRAKLEA
jgi:acyl-CoA thioester hydrolase